MTYIRQETRDQRPETKESVSSLQSPVSCLKRGSLSIEYAAFIAMMIAALVGMSIYIKHSLEGRWRQVGDTFGHGRQYQPGQPGQPGVTVVSEQ